MRNELWYLATPYSTPNQDLRVLRYQAAAKLAGALTVQYRHAVFSPIAHMHPVSIFSDSLHLTHSDWMEIDHVFLTRCQGLIVATMPGWEESKGVQMEHQWARELGMEILIMEPLDVEIILGPHFWTVLSTASYVKAL